MMQELIEKKVKEVGLELIWIDSYIGIRRGKYLLLNKNLLKYPKYCKKVLDHELRHSVGYSFKDFKMDMTEASLWDNLSFCLKHPKAFLAFFPISYWRDEWYVDINTTIVYIIAIISMILFTQL